MKKLTKVLSLVLALALVLMSVNIVTVNANDTKTVTLTINADDENDDGNHTYVAYQIFKGNGTDSDVKEDNTFGEGKHHTLSNIQWGNGVKSTDFLREILDNQSGSMLTDYNTVIKQKLDDALITDTSSAKDFAAALSTILDKDESRATRMLALVIKNNKDTILQSDNGKPLTQSGGKGKDYTAELPEGYYIVLDTTESGTASDSMLLLLGDQTVSPKHQNASVEKTIVDDESGYSVGDSVDFMVKLHLPSNVESYGNDYVLALEDKLEGFVVDEALANSVKVYLDDNNNGILDESEKTEHDVTEHFNRHIGNKSTDYPPLPESYADSGIDPGKEKENTLYVIHKYDFPGHSWAGENGKILFVTYSAILSATAVNASATETPDKFTNTAQLTYSNDPDGTSVGLNPNTPTPDPQTTSYSFKLQIDKVDEEGTELTGAGFKLEKLNTGSRAWTLLTDNSNVQISPEDADKPDTAVSTFKFAGLGDGVYKLTETQTPSGYNTIAPQYIKIESVKTGQNLTELKGTQYDSTKADIDLATGNITAKSTFSGYAGETLTGPESTPAYINGTLVAKIQNESGINLPETGGMGTKIFYTLGGVLVVGAVVLLVVKRRMRAE